MKILVIAQVLAACAAMLAACGLKGPLVLPKTPDSAGRATLTQSLNPWHAGGASATVAPASIPSAATPASAAPATR